MAQDQVKKMAEGKQREKIEDRLAMQRVREQIASDRAEIELLKKAAQSQPTTAAPQTAASAPKKQSTSRLKVSFLLDHHINKKLIILSCIY